MKYSVKFNKIITGIKPISNESGFKHSYGECPYNKNKSFKKFKIKSGSNDNVHIIKINHLKILR